MLTFRNLFPPGQRPKEFIGHCGALLPNRMQCPKGGTWEVTDDVRKSVTQYCTMHARILEETAKKQGIQVVTPEATPQWPEGAIGKETPAESETKQNDDKQPTISSTNTDSK